MLKVAGTDRVFPPGQLTFNLAPVRPVEVRALACIGAVEAADATTRELTLRVHSLLAQGSATDTRPSC